MAVFLAIALVYTPVAPAVLYAQEATSTTATTTDTTRSDRDRNADTAPPVIEAHANVNAQATSEAGAVVSYTSPVTADDVDGAGVASCAPPSGSNFPVGNTSVTCTATDVAGNTATMSFFVKVAPLPPPDTTPPTIAAHDDVSVQATSTSDTVVTYTPPATSDNVDAAGVALCTPPSDSTFAIGTTTVTCTATDAAGNSATSTTFNVIVAADTQSASTTVATSTPSDTSTGTGGDTGTGTATSTPPDDPSAASTASADSAEIPPSQSGTDNTDFQNIINGASASTTDSTLPLIDASATSTEALAIDPLFKVATSTDGTGSKFGGTIFTGSAVASTTVKNVLNITRSNVDGPGVTNSSRITADNDNVGTVTTADDTRALTGDNNGFGGEGDATIHTGKAVSSAQVLNVVNTNFFNSTGQVLFLNPQNGDGLDLRAANLSYFLDGGVGASPTTLGCTILTCLNSATLQVLNKNVGTVNNNVLVRAATGGNAATSTKAGGIDIQTGDAYASAAVLNLVNTNFINSKYLVATFDNFGSMQGDVVLPDAAFFKTFFKNGNTLPDLNSSSYIVSNDNDETFAGTTTANALTGGNIATTTPPSTGSGQAGNGHGEIRTGKAHTSSTSYTAANQTHVGGSSALFVFHVSGAWNGTVKGLPEGMSWRRTDYGIEVYSTGTNSSSGTQGIYNSATFIASSTNMATVKTDVNVWAETGSNHALTENGTSTIATGDAYATANVVNMVNTNVVNRNFMFVVFNIAGDWNGDIDFGGHSPNMKVTTTIDAPTPTIPGSDVTYHFAVANNGDVEADNVVLTTTYDKHLLCLSRSDTLNTNTTTGTRWHLDRPVASGASREITATGKICDSIAGFTTGFLTIPLTALVSSDQRDQDDSDNTQGVSVVVSLPDSGSTGGTTGTDSRDRGDRTDTGSTPPPSGGGGGSPPPSGGGGGGGAPPPSGGGGGGGGPPPASSGGGGGGGGPPPASSPAANNTTGNAAGNNANNSAAPGGTGGAGGGSVMGTTQASLAWVASPKITVIKTVSVATSTLPATVDYKVTVTNAKTGGPAYRAVLTDTLSDPLGTVMYKRSWDLDTLEPGDMIKLTYSVLYAATSTPGTYTNVARVTGFQDNQYLSVALIPVAATGTVRLTSAGLVLGVSTSTSPVFSDVCEPLLNNNLRPGSADTASVMRLQGFLNAQGSNLPVTGFFGPMTTNAVKLFQKKFASEILTPSGLSLPTGLVYSATMRKINTLACGLPAQAGGVAPTTFSAPASGTVSVPGVSTPSSPAKPKTPAAPKVPAPKPPKKPAQSDILKSMMGLVGGLHW